MPPKEPYSGPERRSSPRPSGTYIGIGVVTTVLILLIGVVGVLRRGGGGDDGPTVAPTSSTAPAETRCPNEKGTEARVTAFDRPPPFCIDPRASFTATITTDVGALALRLDASKAPATVNDFVVLARYHFYDGLTFHHVVRGSVVQGGDPNGDGSGGPGYALPDDSPPPKANAVGSVSLVATAPKTYGSQLAIVSGGTGAALAPTAPAFAQVTAGLDVLAAIDADGSADASGTPTVVHRILTITVTGG